MKISNFIDKNIPALNGKTYIITGANSGIGFEMAKILLSKGAKVVFACRNEEKAKNAINSLKEEQKNNAFFELYDQSNFESIDNFVKKILTKYNDFNGVILNAAIFKPRNEKYTKQGFRCVVGTNYLGAMYFVERLKRLDPVGSRKIVFQSSLMAKKGKYKDNELITASSVKFSTYNFSKTGINLYFNDCLENDKNNYYFLAEPGICYSNIYNDLPKIILPAANVFMKLMFHSAQKGGLSAVMLVSKNYENGTVLYPRGVMHISGYPKIGRVSKKIKKSHNLLCEGKELINKYL